MKITVSSPPGRLPGRRLPPGKGFFTFHENPLTRGASFFSYFPRTLGCRSIGRTPDSDSVNQGSSPCSPAIKRPHRLAWPRTPAFHAGDGGSNPPGDATEKASTYRNVGAFSFHAAPPDWDFSKTHFSRTPPGRTAGTAVPGQFPWAIPPDNPPDNFPGQFPRTGSVRSVNPKRCARPMRNAQ